jgi:hypothetical protein
MATMSIRNYSGAGCSSRLQEGNIRASQVDGDDKDLAREIPERCLLLSSD